MNMSSAHLSPETHLPSLVFRNTRAWKTPCTVLLVALAGLLVGCASLSQQVYGPQDVAAREAKYEALLAEMEPALDKPTYEKARATWQQYTASEAESKKIFAERGIVMDSDYYRLKCKYLDGITDMLRMLEHDNLPQPAAGKK